MRTSWIFWVAPQSNDEFLIAEEETQRPRRESYVMTEAELGVMQPQTKDHLEPPETRRGKEGLFSTRSAPLGIMP